MPTTEEFKMVIRLCMLIAQRSNLKFIEINSGSLHRAVGGYPGPDNRMPICCNAMRNMMQDGDEILETPPQGQGANLTIRYKLPRV